ncbi:MAG: hypothetical protein OMOMHJEC_02254 [Xanthomonadales bacterium]|nr:hypothetical protein [Xanthomonadales bacterium]
MSAYSEFLKALHDSTQRDPATPGADRAGSFAAQGELAMEGVAVAVEGLGTLEWPLSPMQAQALLRLSVPASYGLRERTLLDVRVRDTGEIAAARLALDWEDGARTRLLEEVARGLGVEAIDCRLHSLLVYGPGQFFKPHQDTEKCAGMVGTLVLIWPSAHIGGALRIEMGQRELRFVSQQLATTAALRWCAFYADCRHEVERVEEGWRVALTFDLVVPADASVPAGAADPALVAALRSLFAPAGAARTEPLVFLLDHDYSEHGLYWRLLKGRDRAYAQALAAAAEALGLSVHLALAEQHEIWDAQFSGRGAEPEKGDFIDGELVLDLWRDRDDRVLSRERIQIDAACVAAYTESGEEHLENEEYEGYMGNYGETIEYWYRRAALVIQSPLSALRMRYRIEPDAALADLLTHTSGPPARLAQHIAAVQDLLLHAIRQRGRNLLAQVTVLAARTPDAEQAQALVAAFDPASLEPEDAGALAALALARGHAWMRDLLQDWSRRRSASSAVHAAEPYMIRPGAAAPALWPRALDRFLQTGLDAGLSAELVDDWLDGDMAALEQYDSARAAHSPANLSATRQAHVDAVLGLARALALRPAHEAVIRLADHLRAQPRLYPAEDLAELARTLDPSIASQSGTPLRTYVAVALERRLAEPERAADDHALREIEWVCRCADCSSMVRWAESRTAAALRMSIAERRRDHVIDKLRLAAAPVTHRTIKQGSPHKLELTKPADLSARDRAQRKRWAEALAQLR